MSALLAAGVVDTILGTTSGGRVASPGTVPIEKAVPAGAMLSVVVSNAYDEGPTGTTVTDSQGNTYTLRGSFFDINNFNGALFVWDSFIRNPLTTADTMTIEWVAGLGDALWNAEVYASSFSGIGAFDSITAFADIGTDFGHPPLLTTHTPSAPGDLVIGYSGFGTGGLGSGPGVTPVDPGAPWTSFDATATTQYNTISASWRIADAGATTEYDSSVVLTGSWGVSIAISYTSGEPPAPPAPVVRLLPYAGAPVSRKFRERWLNTRRQVGDSKPVGRVQIRRGRLNRTYHPYPGGGYPTFGEYPGVLGIGFWYPDWQVNSDWQDLDGVDNIKLTQDFSSNGVQSCIVSMDNIALVPTSGAAGMLYHLFEEGYYSPLRGFVGKGRPNPGVSKTPFFGQLPNAQIRVLQGYGEDEMVCTFLGLIDDIQSDSTPNTLTINARDHGGVLVDERFFGWAVEKHISAKGPITFAPRHLAEKSRLVGGSAHASSSLAGFAATEVTKRDSQGWVSDVRATQDDTEWVEISVPKGKFSQLFAQFRHANMHAYIGIRPGWIGAEERPRFDGADMTLNEDGWWNPYGKIVPGTTDGGWPFFAEINATTDDPPHYISLGGAFEVGDNTVVRIGFRNLGVAYRYQDNRRIPGNHFDAGVVYLQVNQRNYKESAIAGRYIIIDDLSDIVRCVLRWCGFKGWEVESTGANLRDVYHADSSKTFMDLINLAKDQSGFTFFMGEPRDIDNDQDLGYPIFRNARILEDHTAKTEFIDDRLLLTDAKLKISNADDHCIIRCRGIAKDDGVALGEDTVRRIMFAYIPPWAKEQAGHQAGVLKPVDHTDILFTTVDECEFGCYLIAIQILLLKYTAIIDLPGNPGIGLDTLQSVIDRKQGFNSRLYVSNRTQEMQFGANGYWHMELGGSAIDTPDWDGLMADYTAAVKRIDRRRRDPWLRKRRGKTIQYGYQDR